MVDWVSRILGDSGEPLSIVVTASRSFSDNSGPTNGDHVNRGNHHCSPRRDGSRRRRIDHGYTVEPGNPIPVTFIPYNPATVVTGNPSQWFNPLMFNPGRVGFLGTSPRNTVEGPHLSNFDFSINKDTVAHFFGEAGQIEFRAEFFNIFNHANFGMPNGAALWELPPIQVIQKLR